MGHAWADQPFPATSYAANPMYSWSPAGGAVHHFSAELGSYGITGRISGIPCKAFASNGVWCGRRTVQDDRVRHQNRDREMLRRERRAVDTYFTVLLHT